MAKTDYDTNSAAESDTDMAVDGAMTPAEDCCVFVHHATTDESESSDTNEISDDEVGQVRHNQSLKAELKKRSPNDEVVREMFKKGSTQRLDWIQGLGGATRSKEVLQAYPCYAKASYVSPIITFSVQKS